MFPSLASTSIELVFMQPTKHSTIRGALSTLNLYNDAFVSGFDMDPYKHTRHTSWCTSTCGVYLREVSCRYHAIYRMSWSVLRYPKLFSTLISTYLEISLPRVLGTIPNTHVSKPPLFLTCERFLYHIRFLIFVSPEIRRNFKFNDCYGGNTTAKIASLPGLYVFIFAWRIPQSWIRHDCRN